MNDLRKNYNKLMSFSPPLIEKEEINEVVKTLKSGWITTGPKVKQFEKEFCRYIGCRYAIALNSCTAGLFLALLVGGIKKGDEVITTPYTFAATANVIIHLGAEPVFVDVDKKTFNIDPGKIEEKITKKTKAIIPVHFGGRPCEMDKILRIAKRHKLIVIEDAAHAVSAKYKNKKIGAISNFTAFSFHAVKNLTTAEGGMLTTNNKQWSEKIRMLAYHGIDKLTQNRESWRYKVIYPGYKFNMTDMAASLGLWQLRKLEKHYQTRLRLVKEYNSGLKKLSAISIPNFKLNGRHSLHLYPILLKDNYLKIKRDKFIMVLKEQGIATNVHYFPLHLMPFYRKKFGYKSGDFPNAEYLYEREITLPLHLQMKTNDVKYIVGKIKKITEKYQK